MNDCKYKCVYMPNHARAFGNGTVYEHVLVAEEKIGRPLKEEEVVHHMDEDKSNNSPDNIVVFKSRGAHTRFHNGGKMVIGEDGIVDCPIENQNRCKMCGVEIYYSSTYCKNVLIICKEDPKDQREMS